jgi:hypothetical protein
MRRRQSTEIDASEREAEEELRALENEVRHAERMMTTPPPENLGSNDDGDED